jgi:hypothetical protein
MPRRQMTGNVADDSVTYQCYVANAWRQRLLGMVFAVEVRRHPRISRTSRGVAQSTGGHRRNIGARRDPKPDVVRRCHHRRLPTFAVREIVQMPESMQRSQPAHETCWM